MRRRRSADDPVAPPGPVELPGAVVDWCARARYRVTAERSNLVLTDPGVEVVFFIEPHADGTVALFRKERDEASRWLMSAPDVEALGRFLCVELAPVVRRYEDRQPRVLSFGVDPTGELSIRTGDDRLVVQDGSGAVRATFPFQDFHGVHRAGEFTFYADRGFADLVAVLTVDVRRDPEATT